MLLRRAVLDAIAAGRITQAFRRWRRVTVRSGGRQRTAAGELEIKRVEPVEPAAITEGDARAAGFASRAALLQALDAQPAGRLYRIVFGSLHPDPRVALRAAAPGEDERAAIAARLDRLDAAARTGPWTRAVLRLIGENAGVSAAVLADRLGQEKLPFKRNVRKLKELGLTESLKTGYRLSPRGLAVLDGPRQQGQGDQDDG